MKVFWGEDLLLAARNVVRAGDWYVAKCSTDDRKKSILVGPESLPPSRNVIRAGIVMWEGAQHMKVDRTGT